MYGFTTANGQLTVASTYTVNSYCCRITNLATLLGYGDLRGQDTITSGGVTTNPVRYDPATRHTLNLIICGDGTHAGTPNSDPIAGLIANILYLRSFTDPTGTGDGTQALELAWGGETLTADGRIGPLVLGDDRGVGEVNATCDVVLPFGPFA